ncbi:hypothetical protein L6452_10030, partial [Arctium lappa]
GRRTFLHTSHFSSLVGPLYRIRRCSSGIQQASSTRLQRKMYIPLLGNIAQEAVYVLLPKVLRQMLVRASGCVWQQTDVCLLQQLEDSRRQTQVSL